MAEAWTNKIKGDQFEAYSAGVAPKQIDPTAVEAMAEAGIDISAQKSKDMHSLEQVYDERFAKQYGFFRPYVRHVIYRFPARKGRCPWCRYCYTVEPVSKRPLLPDLCVTLKFWSSKYQIYSCG